MTQKNSSEGVAAVDRAMSVLAALERQTEPLSLVELSRMTGFYKSTLLRILTSLQRANIVTRRADGRYALGSFAFRLGRAYEASYPLREAVLPLLHELVEQGSESASFHVRADAEHRVCLFRINSHHPTLDSISAGDMLPLNKGAPGRILCTEFPSGKMSPSELIFSSFGEREASCAAVAAPVFDAEQRVVGAISLSGPAERFTEKAMSHMSKLLLRAAQRATEALGGKWPARS